jgi:hypothetical protein
MKINEVTRLLNESWSWDDPVIPSLGEVYTYKDLALDMGFLAADIAASVGTAGVGTSVTGPLMAAKIAQRASVIRKVIEFTKGIIPNPAAIAKGIAKLSPSKIASMRIEQWGTIGKQAIMQILATLGFNVVWDKMFGHSKHDNDDIDISKNDNDDNDDNIDIGDDESTALAYRPSHVMPDDDDDDDIKITEELARIIRLSK